MDARLLSTRAIGVVLPAVLLLAIIGGLCAAAEPPSAGFIAASLKHQLCSGAVDIRYSYYFTDPPRRVVQYRYIRTPDYQYLEAMPETDERTVAYYDKKAGRLRLFGRENGKKVGRVDRTKDNMQLSFGTLPDPVLYNLPTGELEDLIGRGTVSGKMETMDGQPCWRVDIAPSKSDTHSYTFWVDPAIGFAPRRIEARWGNDMALYATLSGYKSIGSGVWYPSLIHWDSLTDGKVDEQMEARIDSASIALSASDLKPKVDFPSGTAVEDRVLDARYTVP